MEKIALFAGKGRLPNLWYQEAQKRDCKVFVFPISSECELGRNGNIDLVEEFKPGNLQEIIALLQKYKIDSIIMQGKFEKNRLFTDFTPGPEMQALLASLPDMSDDSILAGLMAYLENQGIQILPQTVFLEDFLPQPGILTSGEPTSEIEEDMKFGFEMAQKIGALGIGQTVVVKEKSVVAVEAMEGTDQTLLRAGELGIKDCVMAKVFREDQDLRSDIPVVGKNTLENLIKIEAKGLVLEAEKTFIMEKDEFLREAEKSGITVAARKPKEN